MEWKISTGIRSAIGLKQSLHQRNYIGGTAVQPDKANMYTSRGKASVEIPEN